ncbi:MAG: DUF3168 domain-containing protein [Acidobacteriota bacterium]
MANAAVLASIRTWLLASAGVAALVGARIHVSRADVSGVVPALALELGGGSGALNPGIDQVEIRVNAWSSVSWSEALAALDAAADALRNKTFRDGLPAPALSVIRVGAPSQISDQTYFHAQLSVTVLARGGA